MLRHGRSRDRQTFGELADCTRLAAELLEEVAPVRISDSCEGVGRGSWGHYSPKTRESQLSLICLRARIEQGLPCGVSARSAGIVLKSSRFVDRDRRAALHAPCRVKA